MVCRRDDLLVPRCRRPLKHMAERGPVLDAGDLKDSHSVKATRLIPPALIRQMRIRGLR